MSRRIVVAGLHHESNTFNPIVTTEADFNIQYGEELFDVLNDDDSISGIVKTLLAEGYEVVPTVAARAVPNGEVDAALFDRLKRGILSRVRDAAPFDALVLSLHGSMRIAGFGKAESDLLEALRAAYLDTLIVTSLDMHATVTEGMTANADAFVGYKQAPHTDCFATGAHAARIAIAALENGATPVMASCRVPVLIAGEKSETSVEPMRSLIDTLRSIEERNGIMAASLLLGFPWADSEENGVCALVVSDGDADLAQSTAEEIAGTFWARRDDFTFHTESYEPKEAIDTALRGASNGATTPIFVSESGDNPTAGSAGDNTAFLQLIAAHEGVDSLEEPLVYGGIYDPAAVARCIDAVGETIDLEFGGAFDRTGSVAMRKTVTVVRAVRSWGTYQTDLARIRFRNIDAVLASKHIGWITPDIFRALDIVPEHRQVVVVKLGYLTAAQRTVAKRSILALTAGNSNELLETLPYRRIARPIFPLDREFAYSPSGH